MRRRFITCALCATVFAGLSFGAAQNAFAERPYDLSDITQPIIEWPYKITSFTVTGVGYETKHEIHVDMAYDKVIKDMQKTDRKYGKFTMMGLTKQAGREMYQAIFAYNNEHHYVQITPDGAGTLIVVEAMPNSYETGVYDPAAFGFRMPDGSIVPFGRFGSDGL